MIRPLVERDLNELPSLSTRQLEKSYRRTSFSLHRPCSQRSQGVYGRFPSYASALVETLILSSTANGLRSCREFPSRCAACGRVHNRLRTRFLSRVSPTLRRSRRRAAKTSADLGQHHHRKRIAQAHGRVCDGRASSLLRAFRSSRRVPFWF